MSHGIPDYEFEEYINKDTNNGYDKHSGGLKSAMARRFRGYLPVVIEIGRASCRERV